MAGCVRAILGTLVLATCSSLACGSFGASDDLAPGLDGVDASTLPSDAMTVTDAKPAVDCSLPGSFCDDFEASGGIDAAKARWGFIIGGANLSIVAGGLSGQMLHAEDADAGAGRLFRRAPGLSAAPTYLGLEFDVRLSTNADVDLASYRFVRDDGSILQDVEVAVRGGRVLLAEGTTTGTSSGGTIKVGEWTHVTLSMTSSGVTLGVNASGGSVTAGSVAGLTLLPTFAPAEVRLNLGPTDAKATVDFDNYRFRVE